MPWKETTTMEQKVEFISEWLTHQYTITNPCLNLNGLSLHINNRTRPHQAHPGQSCESLSGFYWYRLAEHDLSMATSEHRENGNCTYNLTSIPFELLRSMT